MHLSYFSLANVMIVPLIYIHLKRERKEKKKSETHLHFSFLCCCLCHKLADQWIQYDLGPPRQITGVVTRGHGGWESKQRHHVSWVSSYTLSYSNDTLLWFSYRDGNHLDPKVSTLFLFPISSKLKNFFSFNHLRLIEFIASFSSYVHGWAVIKRG